MILIKTIAKECNVSIATVSKALNNHNDISEKTKIRIKKVADEMGYFPNSAAIALKTKHSFCLGVLYDDEGQEGSTPEYFSTILNGFKVEAEKKGYDIMFINSKIGTRETTYLEHCKYRGMDGVVIACIDFTNREVIELINSNIPIITIDHVFDNCTSIISDNAKGIVALVQYVYNQGHRKIAYIRGDCSTTATRTRIASFNKACEELLLEVPEDNLKTVYYWDSEDSKEKTFELLDLKERPTCIFYSDDIALLGGLNAAKDRNLRVPEDLSVVGYDGIIISQLLSPKLTTIKQDGKKIGEIAAKELIDLIEKPKTTLIERIVVEGQLLEGESVYKIGKD